MGDLVVVTDSLRKRPSPPVRDEQTHEGLTRPGRELERHIRRVPVFLGVRPELVGLM